MCLIVDDSQSFLRAARSILERGGITVVGVASTIAEALRRAGELQPDVILVDMMLGDESGIDLVTRLAESGSTATAILVSAHAESDFSDLIKQTRAAGFVQKHELSAAAVRGLAGERGEM
jgi:two-component system nitrate/nitrite response regulator NarL